METFLGAIGVLIVCYALAKMLGFDGVLRANFKVRVGYRLFRLAVLFMVIALGFTLYERFISIHLQ